MPYLGNYTEDYTKVNFIFPTLVGKVMTAMAGSPVISVFKGNGTTQSTAGITLTEGFDGNPGSNQVLIDLSADAFYAVGEDYTAYISVGTLGGVTLVGRPVATFSIENRFDEVDVTKISGDSTAADNLELQYDTTGLAGDTFPATQSQLAGIANVGSAVNRAAASYVLTTGTQSANTVSSVAALDGTRHEHTDDSGVMELYYEFLIGAGIPSSVTVTGYLNSNNDDLEVYGYDWVAAAFVRIGTLAGKNSSTNEVNAYGLFIDMVGTGSDFGKVRIQFKDGAFTLTSATLAIDQIFVSFSQPTGGYELGAIWIDTNLSNTNTVSGVDGISTNPVSTIAAANTLSVNLNLDRFHIATNSSITFAASQENQEFLGLNWTLALGGQSISNSHITGADVSGTATGAVEVHFDHCEMDDCDLGGAHLDASDLEGDLTLSKAATYFILGCYHTASASPVIDFGTAASVNTTIHIHDYHGAITIKNMGQSGTDVLHFSSPDGKLTLDSSNIGGTVNLNGVFDFVNSGSGQTINKDGQLAGNRAEITGAPAATATMAEKIDFIYEALRNRITVTETTKQFYDDADVAQWSKALSDDGTTFDEKEGS